MGPGAMALNLSPYLPHSTARDLVMASTPDLAAALGTTNPDPLWAYVVVMDTTLAPVPVETNNTYRCHRW